MKYFVEIEGREIEVDLSEDGERLSATIGDERYLIDERDVDRLGQYSNLVDCESYAVSLEKERDKYRVAIGGEGFTVICEDERERAASALEGPRGSGGGIVESVMPGVVLKLEVELGQRVEPDTTLLILEAMKMQNEIKADAGGVISQVFVEEGNAVGAGEKLVEIRVEDEE